MDSTIALTINTQAEASVLAAILQEDKFAKEISSLSESDFCGRDNRDLFLALRELYLEKKPCNDLVTLSEKLSQRYGGREAELLDAAIVMQGDISAKYSFVNHVAVLKAATYRRRCSDALDRAVKSLDAGTDTDAVIEQVRQEFRDLSQVSDLMVSLDEVLTQTLLALDRRSKGSEPSMSSGISTLDAITTGFHKGELTIIGARPAVGKSAFAMNIALASARQGHKVAVCSREMTAIQYGTRVIQRCADVGSEKLRTGNLDADDWASIANALRMQQGLGISFLFATRDIEDLRAQVQNRVDSDGLDMLVVDYTQLMQSKDRFEKEYQRIGYVSKMLKDMTVDFNIAVIALAQVGRATENLIPSLSDLRGSGDMEQDADNVIFLHRPLSASDKGVFPGDRPLFEAATREGKEYITIRVAKQRQGKTGTLAVLFSPENMNYYGIGGKGKP